MREAAKIVVLATGAAVLYAIAQDQLTARISLEYFTVAHRPLVASTSATRIGIAWGAAASWWLGAGLGVLLAVAARAGGRVPRTARSLVGPVATLLGIAAGVALLGGAIGFLGGSSGALALPAPLAAAVAPVRHARFLAAWGATLGAYAAALAGGLALCVRVWRGRARSIGHPIERARDWLGLLLYYGSLAGLAIVLSGPLALAWWASGVMLRPPWYVHPGPGAPLPVRGLTDPAHDFGLAYEDVAFATEGGATLRGWLVPAAPPSPCAAVLAGGGWTDRRSLLALAPALHAAGLTVLAFDYREHGQSDGAGRGVSFGLRESGDVESAVRFVERERGTARTAVIGFSMGGAAAILAAGSAGSAIDAVVASSPGTTLADLLDTYPDARRTPAWLRGVVARILLWRIGAPPGSRPDTVGPLAVIDRVAPRPLLLLHGQEDPVNSLADARRLFERAREPKQLVVVAGASHLDVLDDPGGEALRTIVEFAERSVCAASQ